MPTIREIQCLLHIEGQPALEYGVECFEPKDSHSAYASWYIEAHTDKPFSLHVECLGRSKDDKEPFLLETFVSIDGVNQHHGFRPTTHVSKTFSHYVRYDTENQKFAGRPWIFGSLKFSDNENDHNLSFNTLKNLGTIKLKLWRIQWAATGESPKKLPEVPKIDSGTVVSENKMKGLPVTHRVTLGKETMGTGIDPVFAKYNRIDFPEKAYAEFTIYYRSKENLQSLGLIPYTPTPTPDPQVSEPESDDIAIMTPEEMRAELTRLRKLATSSSINMRIKHEATNGEQRIKREGSDEIPQARKKHTRREFIDLI